jgi:glycosyltransferase involved in cell wall biosynthesis
VYKLTSDFYESVEKCLKLEYPNFEIMIGVDSGVTLKYKSKKIKILKTNSKNTGPAEKRDIGIVKSKAEFIAFLDDDSYPDPNWLNKAIKIFALNPKIAAVGGPGLTPPSDNKSQKITGAILSTFWGTGPYYYRFVKGKPRMVDDYPAYNLIVRRKTLMKVGGFANKFYGGEDTALCIKLVNAGEKILYHPEVVVYHHRRSFPVGYLRQVGNVGLHRGFFVKKYPQTSLRPSYFMPLLGVVFIFLSAAFFVVVPALRVPVVVIYSLLYISVIADTLRSSSLSLSLILPPCIALAHMSYAYFFLKGLLISKLER